MVAGVVVARLACVLGASMCLCIGVSDAVAAGGWVIEPTPNPSGTTQSELEAVSCSGVRACTAVGFYKRSSGRVVTLAERWNGRRWTIEATPNPPRAGSSVFEGVSCPTPKTCTAVGFYKRSSGRVVTLAERWNGKRWTIEATPNPAKATIAQSYGVSCTAVRTCTAVGSYLSSASEFVTLAERWNGKTWTIEATPNPAGATAAHFYGVSCTAVRACTAVGSYLSSASKLATLAESWNGKTWTTEATPNPTRATFSGLDGVSCAAVGDCTAVGFYRRNSGGVVTLAESWNGKRWTTERTPNPPGAVDSTLYGVSCTATNACTAVGPYRNRADKQGTLAEAWNGKEWTIETTPKLTRAKSICLYGTSCTSAGGCTAVGHYQKKSGLKKALAERDL